MPVSHFGRTERFHGYCNSLLLLLPTSGQELHVSQHCHSLGCGARLSGLARVEARLSVGAVCQGVLKDIEMYIHKTFQLLKFFFPFHSCQYTRCFLRF